MKSFCKFICIIKTSVIYYACFIVDSNCIKSVMNISSKLHCSWSNIYSTISMYPIKKLIVYNYFIQ